MDAEKDVGGVVDGGRGSADGTDVAVVGASEASLDAELFSAGIFEKDVGELDGILKGEVFFEEAIGSGGGIVPRRTLRTF